MRARLEGKLMDVQKKSDRLLKRVEEGHADAAVASPRLNELATTKRCIGGELVIVRNCCPKLKVADGTFRNAIGGQAHENYQRPATSETPQTSFAVGKTCSSSRLSGSTISYGHYLMLLGTNRSAMATDIRPCATSNRSNSAASWM